MDTHFWLYNKDHTHIDDYEVMHFDGKTVSLDENTRFVASKPTKLVAHGLGGGTHIDHIFNAAYAKAGYDYNVIGIDWRDLQGDGYKAILDLAGNHSARFLKGMVEDYKLKLNDVHAIGFSYGTHVIGDWHTLQMFTGNYRVLRADFCNIYRKNPVIFTDCREIPANIAGFPCRYCRNPP